MLPSSSHRLTCVTPAFLAEICTCVAESGVTASSSGLFTCTRGMFLSSVRMRLVVGRQLELLARAADLADDRVGLDNPAPHRAVQRPSAMTSERPTAAAISEMTSAAAQAASAKWLSYILVLPS